MATKVKKNYSVIAKARGMKQGRVPTTKKKKPTKKYKR